MLFLRRKLATASFLLLALLYLAQTLLEKPDPSTMSRYHLSSGGLYALDLTIAVPYILIWFVALVGYLRLQGYQLLIHKSKDGEAFRYITWGILGIGLFLPLSTLITNAATRYVREHPSTPFLVQLSNYINVLILLVAVIAVYKGSRRLLTFLKAKDVMDYSNAYVVLNIIFIALSAIYVALALHDPSRRAPTRSVAVAGYYESDPWLVTTVIIPRLITWYLGLEAVINIYLYRRKVNGELYRVALKRLAFGIGWALVAIVVLRMLQTLSETLAKYSLGALLILVYILLIFIGIGYWYIARGAKDLQKLEEI